MLIFGLGMATLAFVAAGLSYQVYRLTRKPAWLWSAAAMMACGLVNLISAWVWAQ